MFVNDKVCKIGVFLFPDPNLYLTDPALNLYLPAAVLNFCLLIFRFTVKVCYSQPRFQCLFCYFFRIALGTRLCYSYSVYLY